ncbi:alginate export family protein [Lutibacter sp. TH_r2]|uniref:alginate export family protein n=1 Tax=Lutibacter sp. TH_r2 TaxID=3082083 RepID=UPI00295328D5|nr:alginate export family protein [Lutibacter sp. TH_r2]MDV7186003.1 alginate export family protein [Lutibacter sp. TH_r2]
MRKYLFLSLFVTLFVTTLTAQQFDLSAEIRPRFENRHGYKSLISDGVDGANFVSQRSRLNFNFQQEKIKIGISLQNVRVWGDISTLGADDNNTALHEAWAEALLSENFSLKLGRQEIIYDDSRIFGNVGWAQQGRSHDAMLAKFKISENSKLDLGFALNSDSESNTDVLYTNVAGYKAFQYAWYNTKLNNLGVSLLVLNNGVEYDDMGSQEVDYSQTLGTHLKYGKGKLAADFSAYFQTGKLMDNDVNASNFAGNINYKLSNEFSLGLGAEYLSGKDMDDASSDIKSFQPFYGTNHKFNGWMDYFYVGSHMTSVGLVDINVTLAYSKDKFSAKIIPHFFSSAADIYSGSTKMDASLGTEVDLVFGYKVANNIMLNAGYSQMFAKDSMEVLKGGDKDETNSWGWIMFTFKPNLFTSK